MRIIAFLGLLALPLQAASAGETVTFRYDARGRLVKVVHAGSVNNGVTTEYSFDKAGNRIRHRITGAP